MTLSAMTSSSHSLDIYKTLWGVTEPLPSLLSTLKTKGYCGVEACFLYTSAEDKMTLLDARKAKTIELIVLLQTSGKTVQEHLESLEKQIDETLPYMPSKLNIHGGQDSWCWEEVTEYFEGFLLLEAKYRTILSAPLLHETHRGRILYSPWNSLRVMEAFPTLCFTADLSHWVIVAERHLEPEFEHVLSLLAEKTLHIHTRPCSPQHIQLQSLTDVMYTEDLQYFQRYWHRMFTSQLRIGDETAFTRPNHYIFSNFPLTYSLTHTFKYPHKYHSGNGLPSIDPELGPFPYKLSTGMVASQSSSSVASPPPMLPTIALALNEINNGLDEQLDLLVQIVQGVCRSAVTLHQEEADLVHDVLLST